uniref:Uncharacterized protein n=1 Tax=Solanum tuberosum TaxID=4113 RepID=M1DEQ2_SOLTU
MCSSVSLGSKRSSNAMPWGHPKGTPRRTPTLAKQVARAACKLHLEGITPRRGLAPPRSKKLVRYTVVSRTLLSRNLIPNIFREQLCVADWFRDENAEIQKSIFTSLKSTTNMDVPRRARRYEGWFFFELKYER